MNTASEHGVAKNTAAAIQFLDSCPAVRSYIELNADWLEFVFDPSIEVSVVPDHLVWFDEGAAPDAAQDALNAYHNA